MKRTAGKVPETLRGGVSSQRRRKPERGKRDVAGCFDCRERGEEVQTERKINKGNAKSGSGGLPGQKITKGLTRKPMRCQNKGGNCPFSGEARTGALE